MVKKISLILVAVMLLSLLPFQALAYEDPFNREHNQNDDSYKWGPGRNHIHNYIRAESKWEVPYDTEYHEVKINVQFICRLCGNHSYEDEAKEWQRINREGIKLEKHVFDRNDKCTACGYVKRNDTNQSGRNITFGRLDQHEHEYNRIEDSWISKKTQDGRVNILKHEINTRALYVCTICGRHGLKEEAQEGTKTEDAYHNFDENGKCIDCGYEKSQRTKERERNAKRFYRELSRYDQDHSGQEGYNPLDDDIIRSMVREELEASGFGAHADEIINALWHTDAAKYRELCLWTFFDYDRINLNDSYQHPEYDALFTATGENFNLLNSDTWFNLNTFFHETGHATDYYSTINNGYITDNSNYYSKLSNALEERIREMVSEYVDSFEDDTISGIDKMKIIVSIMSTDPKDKASRRLNENQRDVYNYVIKKLNEHIDSEQKILGVDRVDLLTQRNSIMWMDMLDGYTAGKLSFSYGFHGFSYWVDNNGNSKKMQTKEAYAEYFSSQITGDHRDMNRRNFPEACDVMDQMTGDALEMIKKERCIWTFISK